MIRRLIILLSIVSLLIGIAISFSWWRSYKIADRFEQAWNHGTIRLTSINGQLIAGRCITTPPTDHIAGHRAFITARIDERCFHCRPYWSVAGISFESMDESATDSSWHIRNVTVRYWLIDAVFLIPAPILIGAAVQCWLRSSVPGSCAKCGYDLRASRERCPECGAPIRWTIPR